MTPIACPRAASTASAMTPIRPTHPPPNTRPMSRSELAAERFGGGSHASVANRRSIRRIHTRA